MSDSDTFVDISSEIGDTSVCDTYIDTDHSDNGSTIYVTPVKVGRDLDSSAAMTPKIKSMRRYLMSPILRRGYYGRKRARRGYRHFVSSALEYTARSSVQASSRKIPFYTLLMSANKPSNKNKNQQHLDAFVLCDTGASISLATSSIAQDLGMRIDRTELVSVRGVDGKKIKVIGTS